MTMIALGRAILAAFATAFAVVPAQAACDFQKVAELPVTMSGLRPLIPAKVNGVEVFFLADSGAFISTITRGAAAKAGVRGRGSAKGVGGVSGQAAMDVGVANFELAGLPFGGITFLIGGDVIGDEAAGLLGQNLLGRLDVEYDLANGLIRLFSAKGCEDAYLAYWATDKRAGMLTMAPRTRFKPHIIVPAAVNGQAIRALMDTGASTSVLKVAAASRAGIKTSSDGVKIAEASVGISGHSVDTWLAPVSSFAFGDEEIRNTRLRIAKVEMEKADMLLGADFFLSHRVFVSNSQSRLYFTYNGGPVFRLDAPQSTAVADPPAGAAGSPQTADDYARRGAAFAARRDFSRALADQTKAIELEPKSAPQRIARAGAYIALGKSDLALDDLNVALAIDPDNAGALIKRARLYLRAKDPGRAKPDLDALLKDQPADSVQAVAVAEIYVDEGYHREAIPYFDSWIAAHPDDKRMAGILNARCWARAIWGQQLDLALADCEAALRKRPRDAETLDSVGLVHLKLGRLDKAISAYNAALTINPKAGWTLYARGVARQRLGLGAEGAADIAAARALQPNLPELAKRYGLETP